MTVHTCGAKFALYVRKSNRHNWMLTLVASDEQDLERCKRLDAKDFPDYQYAYLEIKNEYATLDDLPKNYPMGE